MENTHWFKGIVIDLEWQITIKENGHRMREEEERMGKEKKWEGRLLKECNKM